MIDPASFPGPEPVPYVLRLSPSRVDKFRLCPARWGYSELPGGTPEPGSYATDYGTTVHLGHELKYTHGTPYNLTTPEGWTARAMAPHLPTRLPPYGAAELELTYEAEPGLTLVGRLDLTWPFHDRGHDGRLTACVTDYKTTGSMRYAKLEREALLGHPQAPLYALMSMRHYGTDTAFLHWVYAERAPEVMPPGGWPQVRVELSDHYVTRDEALERVHLRMVPPAKQMLAAYQSGMTAAQAGELPKNLRACRSFGRLCPVYTTCNPKKEQQMDEANAFLAGLGLSTAAPAAPAPNSSAPPNTGSALINPSGTPPAEDKPAVNPPEVAKGKGKGRASAPVGIDAATIDAIAEAVADKLALRLVRNVP